MLRNSQYELFKLICSSFIDRQCGNNLCNSSQLHHHSRHWLCQEGIAINQSLSSLSRVIQASNSQIVSSRLVLFCHVSSDPIFFGTKICEAAFAMKIRLSFASVAVSHIAWPPCDVQALSGSSGIQPVFRESKLTLLLKEALSGNSRTVQN